MILFQILVAIIATLILLYIMLGIPLFIIRKLENKKRKQDQINRYNRSKNEKFEINDSWFPDQAF